MRADRVGGALSTAYSSHAVKAAQAAYDHFVECLDPVSAIGAVPPVVLTQARLAASELPLDLFLRRCMAVSASFALHVTEVANQLALSNEGRVDLARTQDRVINRLMDSVVAEYASATRSKGSTAEARLTLVKGLLVGEAIDANSLAYDLDRYHVAGVAEGVENRRLNDLAAELSGRSLFVKPSASVSWLWLATTKELTTIQLKSAIARTLPARCKAAFGASEFGEGGWRASHMQALSALSVSLRTEVPAYYEEAMMIATVLGDRVLESYVRHHYLNPIKDPPRGGDALLETLRAYFDADRNGSSAAAALDVSRQTVANRLQVAEHRLGRTLSSCAPELQLALRLDELDRIELFRPALEGSSI